MSKIAINVKLANGLETSCKYIHASILVVLLNIASIKLHATVVSLWLKNVCDYIQQINERM